jgi:Protein of unknown function (DUF3987)
MNAALESPVFAVGSPGPSIPAELLARPQWLAWWSVTGAGRPVQVPSGRSSGVLKVQAKPHKLPINPRTGGLAASTRLATWSSAEDACAAVRRWSLTGIGFVFTDSDSYSGVDIDNCRNPETGQIADWAWKIIQALNSYTEVSPSGTGAHTIIRGKLPTGKGNQVAHQGGKVELFSRARYFTFTGLHLDGTPTDIGDRQLELLKLHGELFGSRNHRDAAEGTTRPSRLITSDRDLITMARQARNGSKFERLWSGQWKGDYPSQSEADLGLCCLLAFWTGKDRARMDDLFRRSSMMRKKWLRTDYREATMDKAIAMTDEKRSSASPKRRRVDRPRRGSAASPGNTAEAICDNPWHPPISFHHVHLPPFPAEALPDWLRAFVAALATATQTPVDLAGMLSLSVIAASCAKKVIVRIKDDYFEPVNLFTVTALPSGSRKTAVFAVTMKPLEEFERSEAKRTAVETAQSQTAYKIKEARLKKLQEQAVNATGKNQEKFTEEAANLAAELAKTTVASPVRCIVDDCTPEKLPDLLQSNGGRIALMSPEGDVFDLMGGRYSTNKTDNFGVYLKGHAGDDLRVDRVGRSAEFVKEPALTIGLAVQPDVIRGLAGKPRFRGRGLLGRFLYALPASLLGRRDTDAPQLPDQVRRNYHDKVLALLHLPFRCAANADPCAHVLTLAPDARERLRSFEAWIEPQLSEFGNLGGMTDWGGKLVGAVGRIAGLLHMAEFAGTDAPWNEPISLPTVEGAIWIGKYLIPHAKAAFAEMGADEAVEKAKVILRCIRHKEFDHFTRRDLHQILRSTFKRATDLDSPLALLTSQEFIRLRLEISNDGAGRPPSPTYDVNPVWALQNFEYCEDSENSQTRESVPSENEV